MGVSHWEIGNKDKAIELTKRGLKSVQAAVSEGTSTSASLAIAYSNLATMHRQIGKDAEAKKFASLAAKLESSDDPTRPR